MQENSALSTSFFFPLFCFSGTLWTLLELPAGAGTCGELGFVTKGGLRNKCLDIALWFPSRGCVSKINSTPNSSVMWGFLSIDCALLGSHPTLWFQTYQTPEKRQTPSMEGLTARVHTFVAVLANCLLDVAPERHTSSWTAQHMANIKLMALFVKANSCCNAVTGSGCSHSLLLTAWYKVI